MARAQLAESERDMGAAAVASNKIMRELIFGRLTLVEERLRDMDTQGVAIQVLSPAPTQYHYWADKSLASRIVDIQNDQLASICEKYPGRFLAFGAIAMQHPDLAARQLRQIMAAGFKGVEISTRISTLELSHPSFEPVWQAAEETGAVIFIHPLGTSLGKRAAPFYLTNIIGQPLETTIALSLIILSGVMDRHPALKLLAAHGGGYLPAYFGRLDHAAAVRGDIPKLTERPSVYLKRMWFDTVVHDPLILAHLAGVVGVDRILVGTDYPFDMGEYRTAELLDSVAMFSDIDRQRVLNGNARRMLGMT